jgi:hypothetical protein
MKLIQSLIVLSLLIPEGAYAITANRVRDLVVTVDPSDIPTITTDVDAQNVEFSSFSEAPMSSLAVAVDIQTIAAAINGSINVPATRNIFRVNARNAENVPCDEPNIVTATLGTNFAFDNGLVEHSSTDTLAVFYNPDIRDQRCVGGELRRYRYRGSLDITLPTGRTAPGVYTGTIELSVEFPGI